MIFFPISAIFLKMFSGLVIRPGQSRSRARAGADLRYDLKISFLDAAFGLTTTIELEKSSHLP